MRMLMWTHGKGLIVRSIYLVQNDPKLLDDDGEIPKSQGKGWCFDSRL